MRNLCTSVLHASDASNQTGITVDSNQLVAASFHFFFGDSLAAGTVKVQASNDPTAQGALAFTPVNWVDIPNATAAVTTGTPKLITLEDMSYRWLRVLFVNTTFFAIKVIQDLTYTAVAPGDAQIAITIRYIGDGVAGSETVNVTGNAIVVHMDPTAVTGSTADQIKDAIDASAPAMALVTVAVSGTGSTVQTIQAITALAVAAGSSTVTCNLDALSL